MYEKRGLYQVSAVRMSLDKKVNSITWLLKQNIAHGNFTKTTNIKKVCRCKFLTEQNS